MIAHLGPDHLSLIASVVLGCATVLLVRAASRARRSGELRRGRRTAWLAAAVAAVAVVLSPVVEGLAERSLWAHMVQHLLLTHAVAPMLALAAPLALVGSQLPGVPARRRLGRGIRRLRRCSAAPVGAMLASLPLVGVMVLWHVPAAYDAAVRTQAVHVVEHATMLGSALLLWTVVVEDGRSRRRFPVGAFVALAAGMAVGVALGAALTFTPSILYARPPSAGPGWDGLADQRAAAALLWGLGGVVMVAAAALVLLRWLERQDAGAPGGRAPQPLPASGPVGASSRR